MLQVLSRDHFWRKHTATRIPLNLREQNTLDLVAWKCGSPNTLLADHSIGHQSSPISYNLPFLIAFLFLTCMPKRFVLWILPSCGDWDNKRIRNLGYIMSHLNSYYSVLCWHSIMHTSVSHFQSCRHGIWTSMAHPHNFSWKGKFLALGGGGPSFLFQFG